MLRNAQGHPIEDGGASMRHDRIVPDVRNGGMRRLTMIDREPDHAQDTGVDTLEDARPFEAVSDGRRDAEGAQLLRGDDAEALLRNVMDLTNRPHRPIVPSPL